jgi:threonine dehydratase
VTQYLSDLVVVPDSLAIRALLKTLQEEKLLIEPAASCCLAALAQRKILVKPHEKVAVIICGGNVGLERLWKWFRDITGTLCGI